jgi:hypothetical protein
MRNIMRRVFLGLGSGGRGQSLSSSGHERPSGGEPRRHVESTRAVSNYSAWPVQTPRCVAQIHRMPRRVAGKRHVE